MPKIAVVGDATAKASRAAGHRVAFHPRHQVWAHNAPHVSLDMLYFQFLDMVARANAMEIINQLREEHPEIFTGEESCKVNDVFMLNYIHGVPRTSCRSRSP